jgi:RNA polymerase sigma-70 factor (ECF subfamily)
MRRVPEVVLTFDKSFIRDLKIMTEMMKECIAEDLTPRQKEIFCLRYYDQLRNKEIAERLNLDETTVSRTLTRAKDRIRKRKSMRLYVKYLKLIRMYLDE